MQNNLNPQPKKFNGVTISSCFNDLIEHREALIKVINNHGMKDVAMENDSAKLIDVIDSSLKMVQDGSAYIGIITKRYGQVPEDTIKNPDNLSITELEFNEAVRLNRPILLFIMGKDHLVHENDIEMDVIKKEKLKAFTEKAKKMNLDSRVERVYASFNSIEEFKEKVNPSVAEISNYLEKESKTTIDKAETGIFIIQKGQFIPKPPTIYTKPKYLGSHKFVGREAELDVLNDWAKKANPYPFLLFEAMGGSGKSMLTWEWTMNYAKDAQNWSGIFWYSFYEKGAIMADFCQNALAYITEQPIEIFRKIKTVDLTKILIDELNRRPWLIILDGLERVLEDYNTIRFAEDKPINNTDKPEEDTKKDPCSCINDEDDDLLLALSTASPSKILASSRLVPRKLLNISNQLIPGVQRISLSGLRPADAEALICSCGITGQSEAIQSYLTTNCDCHPLTIGVLAGLINNYMPNRGNFDAWSIASDGGRQLNFVNLELKQKQNHILEVAMNKLSKKSKQLISTLSLLYEAIDYSTILVFNPHIPTEPDVVEKPEKPENNWGWEMLTDDEKKINNHEYQKELVKWNNYNNDMVDWQNSKEYLKAPKELEKTIRDLELRGLLQYDHQTKRYDLHPVVRGVASSRLKKEETEQLGQNVIDFFSSKHHNPYNEAQTLEDISDGLHIVRMKIRMEHFQEAFDIFNQDLENTVLDNLELPEIILTLFKPYFPEGWTKLTNALAEGDAIRLINLIAICLESQGKNIKDVLSIEELIIINSIKNDDSSSLATFIINSSITQSNLNKRSIQDRLLNLHNGLSELIGKDQNLFTNYLSRYAFLTKIGKLDEAKIIWQKIDPMGRDWHKKVYRSGDAEYLNIRFHFSNGDLELSQIMNVLGLTKKANNRPTIRDTFWLKGKYHIDREEWQYAIDSFTEALRLARSSSISDASSETLLLLSKFQLGLLSEPDKEAEKLSNSKGKSEIDLAILWLAMGNKEQAKKFALEAYEYAWADGEPFVDRHNLNKAIGILTKLNAEIPNLPSFDSSRAEKFPWEEHVEAYIEKLKAEKKI